MVHACGALQRIETLRGHVKRQLAVFPSFCYLKLGGYSSEPDVQKNTDVYMLN